MSQLLQLDTVEAPVALLNAAVDLLDLLADHPDPPAPVRAHLTDGVVAGRRQHGAHPYRSTASVTAASALPAPAKAPPGDGGEGASPQTQGMDGATVSHGDVAQVEVTAARWTKLPSAVSSSIRLLVV
ncbi:hypothetical protein ACFVUN_36245 [Kitasatospora griseola]|uniref:hypothetical protein n=1 Tax=Kitasatospora griseola TaxID=2064 RepID=UPI0036DE7420